MRGIHVVRYYSPIPLNKYFEIESPVAGPLPIDLVV